MIMVSIGTFSWNSIPNLKHHPWQSSVVMLATVIVVVATHNLALGVLVGVLLSGIFFTGKVRSMFGVTRVRDDHVATYTITGQIFFASVDRLSKAFGRESERPDPADHVVIDVTRAHFWDISGVGVLDKVVERMRMNGRSVQVVGLNEASADLVDKFALTDKTGVEIGLARIPEAGRSLKNTPSSCVRSRDATKRKGQIAILAGVLFAAAACEQSDPVQNEFPIAYDYALTLPASFAKQDVMGINSKVEEFVSDDTVINTDFGHYGAPPQCEGNDRSCQVEEEAIGEFQVTARHTWLNRSSRRHVQ